MKAVRFKARNAPRILGFAIGDPVRTGDAKNDRISVRRGKECVLSREWTMKERDTQVMGVSSWIGEIALNKALGLLQA